MSSTQTRVRCESEAEEKEESVVGSERGAWEKSGKGRKVWAERRYGHEGLLGWGEKR